MGDLDLVFPAEVEEAVAGVIGPSFRMVERGGGGTWASSWFAKGSARGVDLDLIGGLALRTPLGVEPLAFQPGGAVELQGAQIPLAPLHQWVRIYRLTKPHKAALLEAAAHTSGGGM